MEADINSVSFTNVPDSVISGKPFIQGDQITLFLKPGFDDLTSIGLNFDLTHGASINPSNGSLHDFSKDSSIQYAVTSQDGQYKKIYNVTVVNSQIDYNFDFEHYDIIDGGYGYNYTNFYELSGKQKQNIWASANLAYAIDLSIMGIPKLPENYPTYFTTNPSDVQHGKRAAEMKTLYTGAFGVLFGKPIAAGNLFLGSLDADNAIANSLASTHFGVPVNQLPDSLVGYFKYAPGARLIQVQNKNGTNDTIGIPSQEDSCDIYAVLFNNKEVLSESNSKQNWLDAGDQHNVFTDSSVVAIARLKNGAGTKGVFTSFSVPFEYVRDASGIPLKDLLDFDYSLALVFTSSKRGAEFIGAIGSTLIVDNIKILTK